MKRLLALFGSSLPFFMHAEMEDVAGDVSGMMSGITSGINDAIDSLSWQAKLMIFWHSMSKIHKLIALALVALVVFFIVCKIFKCGKKCSCGCSSGKCGCSH